MDLPAVVTDLEKSAPDVAAAFAALKLVYGDVKALAADLGVHPASALHPDSVIAAALTGSPVGKIDLAALVTAITEALGIIQKLLAAFAALKVA